MSRTAIYARKSSESEDRQILSIDSQVKELKIVAASHGLRVDHVYAEAKSAKAPGRPVFNEIYSLLQSGRIDNLVCWKLDRLARNPVDGGALIWAIEERKLAAIHTPQRSFVNTGNDKFWMQLEFGMAKKYVDDLSDSVKRGIRAKLDQGWLPGFAPIGYVNDRNTRTIVRDIERWPLVRRMWDMMLTGRYSPAQILGVASNQWGLRTRAFKRSGGKPLAHSAIYRLFMNPFCYGALVHNAEYFQGSHTAMVKKSEFDRVQALLGVAAHPRARRHTFAYAGVAKCGECGAAITAENKTNRHGRKYTYYRCTRHKLGVKCKQRAIQQSEFDNQVMSFFDSITIPPKSKDWAIRRLTEMKAEENEKNQTSSANAQVRIDKCKRELSELISLRIRGLIDDEEYLFKKRQLEEERSRLQEFSTANQQSEKTFKRCLEVIDFVGNAKTYFLKGTPEEKRSILRFVSSDPLLTDKILSIQPQKPILFVRAAITSEQTSKVPFAPQFHGQQQPKRTDSRGSEAIWSGLSDLIRTFYRENPTAPSFKQILAEGKKQTQDPMRQSIRMKGTSRKQTTGSVPKSSLLTIA